MLPIEVEHKSVTSFLTQDDSKGLETIHKTMKDVKKAVCEKARANILSAQQRYKKDYDRKHCKGNVSAYFGNIYM